MNLQELDKLASLIQRNRELLLARWREQVRQLPSARRLDTPSLNDHVPALLDELATALRSHSEDTIPQALAQGSPPAHGLQRLHDGFDIEEVVAEYNILRGCLHDLAEQNSLPLVGNNFHIVNRVLDGAIGLAVQTFAAQRAQDVLHRREEYLAFVAHDLRTPLNAISLASRVLELSLPEKSLSGNISQMLHSLSRNVLHLEDLVRKVMEENTNLQTELGIKLQCREFDLWPFVEALIHDLHPVAGTSSTQMTNKVPDELAVYADANLVRRIFQNLIANAIKYTPRGEVVIGARELAEESAIECWVSDNGAGIPAHLLQRVFEKGETDPHSDGGTGLGLAIVKTFTEAHGGRVAVESAAGVGSTFRFTLPKKTRPKS